MTAHTHLQNLRASLASPPARRSLRVAGLAILFGGVFWAVSSLELTWDQVSPGYLLLNFLILAPLNLLLAAVTLGITARAIGRDIPTRQALQTVAMANVAELLPLPGGAMVRGAALVKAGAGVGESASMVTMTAVLTLSMTVVLSAVALAMLGHDVGWWVAIAGLLAFLAVLSLLARRASLPVLAQMVAVRLATLVLGVLRLATAFWTIGVAVSLIEPALYTVATSLGSTVAIVPGGFGVNEAIAAGLAALIASSPALAFLAVALNRAVGLAAGALIGAVLIAKARTSHE